ncbi:MAG: hypothetical protein WAV47_27105, partial [Blastocatellia bacterium]
VLCQILQNSLIRGGFLRNIRLQARSFSLGLRTANPEALGKAPNEGPSAAAARELQDKTTVMRAQQRGA